MPKGVYVRRKKSLAERFWPKVDIRGPDECWPFTGSINELGYGCIANEDGKLEKAHRVAYRLSNSEIAGGMCVCHKCDNPPCCNPAHLFEGSRKDNQRDAESKGRMFHYWPKRREQHPCWKITEEIRKKVREDPRPQRATAAAYGISKTQVARIRKEQRVVETADERRTQVAG